MIGRITDEVAERVERMGVPLANLKHRKNRSESLFKQLPGVYIDNDAGVRMSIEHLAHNGYRRLAALAVQPADEEHFFEVAHAAGTKLGMTWVEPFVIPMDYFEHHEQHVTTRMALNQWVAQMDKATGVIASTTVLARLTAHACIEQDRQVPHEVGIVTPMGDQVLLTSCWPTISATEYDYYQQGYEAAALLDKLMAGETVAPQQKMLGPVGLVVRDSTDVFLCEDELVSRTMHYISEHLREELTVQGLAEAMGVGKRTLHRKFDEVLGKTVQHEVNRLRVDNLKRLLSETDMKITRICKDCGFSSPSHFSRYFKQHVGEAPSVYRKREREKAK